MLPDAVTFALLGGIESLLSAVVADGMSGRRHRSNCELVAQGVANIGSALFGGICATGTIARTATNVRAGARGPVVGHDPLGRAAAPDARGRAARLLHPARDARRRARRRVLEHGGEGRVRRHPGRSRGDALVLLATFLLTVFRDLTEGIAVGVVLGAVMFMHRMAQPAAIEAGVPLESGDEADTVGERPYEDAGESANWDVMVYRIAGPLFFRASSTIAMALERIGRFPKTVILDLPSVPLADASAAASLKSFVQRGACYGARVYAAGAVPSVRHVLVRERLKRPLVAPTEPASVADARIAARQDDLDEGS